MDGQGPSDLTPPTGLHPPVVPVENAAKVPRRHTGVWVLLGVLLLAALAVVFALPLLLAPSPEGAAPVELAANDSDTTASREAAQQTLENYLLLRAKMELQNVAAWGEPDWAESGRHAASGDRHFSQKRFSAAGREYGLALGLLRKLESGRSNMLAAALESGAAALAADDVSGAVEAYETALRIVPDHQDAAEGIAGARRRGSALEQMRLGRAAEADNDLGAAQGAFREAVKLDSGYPPAAAALKRVNDAIDSRRYEQEMTAALQALDAGETEVAEKALVEAERLRPGDPAVLDARQRLQSNRVQTGLRRLRSQAQARVRKEDWQAAVGIYRKALGIDSAAGFARNGIRRAEDRVKLHAQFDHYLEKPVRLYAATPLANAEKLLSSAGSAPSSEPVLANKIARLRVIVEEARVPTRITLISDGETDVDVYRVARLGRFLNHGLELRPGDYTVVGSRAGYRDVRKVIRVRPGKPVPPLSIRCEETI